MAGDEVRVEPADLRARATTLDEEITDESQRPTPPCGLPFVTASAAGIAAGSDTLRSHLISGNREAERLAAVLSEAADVYQQIDNRAAQALEYPDGPRSVEPVPVNPTLPPSVPPIEFPATVPAVPGGQTDAGFMDVKAAAQIIHSGDSGPMRTYGEQAKKFAGTLRDRAASFNLDGINWDGTAAEKAGDAVRQHKEWLEKLAESYEFLGTEAIDMADAHDKWSGQHPTVAEVEAVEARVAQAGQAGDKDALARAMMDYLALQRKSEDVRTSYSADVAGKSLPKVLDPPPGAAPVPPISSNGDPRKGKTQPAGAPGEPGSGGGGAQPGGRPGAQPGGQAAAAPMGGGSPAGQGGAQPAGASSGGGGSPSGGGGSPAGGGGAPAAPAAGGGLPGGLPGGGPDGLPPLDDPALKPAAASGGGAGGGSGGGAGGGGGGVPPSPLQPAVGAETVAPGAAGTGRAGAATAGPAGAMGAMGGMGGMPMGGHGAGRGQGGGEKKRTPGLAPDEDLYVEDRPFTESVIGYTPKPRDRKDSK
ncbi:PPE domain-containing protein [Mycolicibacterium monacense]|uniref:PPE domain-containing protein n=1 Tax=Mycolicibacterium monacense TaxID=85693 RepID=UPI0007EBCF29|nr:hypothetical protein [Mycolicibacterium monacense]OBB54849.1 hypothetical protein A6B34_09035 [Mycolicibacterium monacense]